MIQKLRASTHILGFDSDYPFSVFPEIIIKIFIMFFLQFFCSCRQFHKLSRNPKILKAVSFEEFDTDEYIEHHHMQDLLCLCARAGNAAAESMLGKVISLNCPNHFLQSKTAS